MTDAASALKRVLRGGPGRAAAMRELGEAGPSAATAVLDYVERERQLLPPDLELLVHQTADDSLVSRMLAWMTPLRPGLTFTAIGLLGALEDRRATQPLLKMAGDEDVMPMFRVAAINALRKLGDPSARDPLNHLFARWFVDGVDVGISRLLSLATEQDARWLLTPMAVASALFSLGEHAAAAGALAIVSIPKATLEKLEEHSVLNLAFPTALGHLASPALMPACRAAANFLAEDMKELLAAILGRIGTRDAFQLLVELSKSRRAATAEAAATWLGRAAGVELPDEGFGKAMAAWWKKEGTNLPVDTVFLRGRPWTTEAFFAELQQRDQIAIADELESVLGIVLSRALRAHGPNLKKTLSALAKTTPPLPVGKFHRFGQTFEPALVRVT